MTKTIIQMMRDGFKNARIVEALKEHNVLIFQVSRIRQQIGLDPEEGKTGIYKTNISVKEAREKKAEGLRYCPKCGWLPSNLFTPKRSGDCKKCFAVYMKERRAKEKEKSR